MKKQRPTIPISEWRFATNLEATRNIQNQSSNPSYECECEFCQNWKGCFTNIPPGEIQQELKRIGIEIEHPTDLYQFEENREGSSLRVIYHAVGKMLSGPNQWKKDSSSGEVLMYHTVSDDPYVSIVVFLQKQSLDASPVLKDESEGELIRIDFKLCMPNSYINVNKEAENA